MLLIYLHIQFFYPKEFKGVRKDANKRARHDDLKIRKKNAPRIRHRKDGFRTW